MTSTYKIVNGDVSMNPSNGHPDMIRDLIKTKQDVKENFLISIQTDNGFGSGLVEMIGQIPSADLSPGSINYDFGTRVQSSIQRLMRLQKVYQFGQRTQLEIIDKILFIRAEPSRTDKTMFRFLVRLQVLAGATVSMGGNVSL